MSEPITTDPPGEPFGAPERLHPLFLVSGLGSRLRGLIGAYAGIVFLAARGMLSTAIIGGILILLFSAVSLYLYWRRFEFRIGANEIRIDSGILSRTHRSIPFDRVQDVDIEQGPIARLLGLARVKFETGASAGANRDEGVLPAIALDRAEALRALVRQRGRQSAAQPREEADEPSASPVYALDFRRLVALGLLNFSLAIFAGLIGLTQTAGDVIGFDPLSRSFWRSLLSEAGPLTDFVLANQIVSVTAGLIVLLVVGVATGLIRTTVKEYGFRLDGTDNGIRRRRGLLTLTDVTLPIRRAQAAILTSGPVREYLGWRELKLQTLASDEGGSGDHVLAPLATEGETSAILSLLGWRPPPEAPQWMTVSKAHVWGFALGLAPLALIAMVQAALMPLFGAIFLAGIVGALAVRLVGWKRTGYLLDQERLLIRVGWWRRRTIILPVRRVQSIDLTQNFVSRWFGIASLVFGVAGGSGFSAHSIPSLPEKIARRLRSDLLSLAS